MLLLDLIFPKYCVNCRKLGDYLCSDCFSLLSFKNGKIKGEGRLDGLFIALSSNRVSKRILESFKKRYLRSLDKLIGELMYESLIQNEDFVKELKNSVFIPMPVGKLTKRKRGFNESEVIANELSQRFEIEVGKTLLYQKGRIVFRKENLEKQTVILVEDIPNKIRLEEAAKILKQNGAEKVFSLSFIRQQKTSPKW